MLLTVLFSFPVAADAINSQYKEGEALVVIKALAASDCSAMGAFSANAYSEAILNHADSFARSFGLEALNTYPEIAVISGKSIIHIRSEHKSTLELISELSTAPQVVNVSPNYIRKVSRIPNDLEYPQLWGMENIGMPKVWDHFTGNETVVVAVIDTGIDYNHPDINANMAKDSYGNYGRRFKDGKESGDPMDTLGHGTSVAGIIGAVGNNRIGVTGVSWNVRMLAVNFMPDGYGEDSDVIAGIRYILSEKAKGLNIRVANLSFGDWNETLPDDNPLGTAIKSLCDAGIICAISAGNDDKNINDTALENRKPYPACFRFDNTISIGAFDSNNERSIWYPTDIFFMYAASNYGGEWVDIAAPGTDIYSTSLNNGYKMSGGTSMAAPHVAGAAALLFAAFPNESASQIKARILNGARNIGAPYYWAHGILDVAGAYGLPVITTSYLLGGSIGFPHIQTLNASGTKPIIWSLDSGTLPSGLILNPNTGEISGTPTTAGTYGFTIRAENKVGVNTKTLSITITAEQASPSINTTSLLEGFVGFSYKERLSANGTASITWSLESGVLPNGLTLNPNTGEISGTPTATGIFNFTIRAANSAGYAAKNLSITITSLTAVLPTIDTSFLPSGALGKYYNQTLIAGGSAQLNWSLDSGNLPNGLSLSSTGMISGTPITAGTFDFTLSATNFAGSDKRALNIVITSMNVPPMIITPSLPRGGYWYPYYQTLSANGTSPIAWSLDSGNMPDGLSLSSSGEISGIPHETGTFDIVVRAANSAGSNTKALSIEVDFLFSIEYPPTIFKSTLSGGAVGFSYIQTLSASTRSLWSIESGKLPDGLILSNDGVISGIPSIAGTFNFTVRASNFVGFDTLNLTIVVNSAPTCDMSLNPVIDKDFGSAIVNYAPQFLHTVTINNTGNQPTGALNISLSGANVSSFKLNKTSATSIAINKNDSFTISPNMGLAAGAHKATVTVSGANVASRSFNVSFTVEPAPTYGISLDPAVGKYFGLVKEGYVVLTPHSVTVSNAGFLGTGELTVVLSGTDSSSFALNKTIISSIAAGVSDSFTVTPNTGLSAGTYTATVTVSGINIVSRSFNVSLIVTPEPVSGISLYPATDKVFDSVTIGYGVQAPHNVTINNTGNQPIGLLIIRSSDPFRFRLNKTSISNIATGGSGNFTITPNKGLAAGTHTARIMVSGVNVTAQSFNVSFTVNQNPTSTYGISLNPATNKSFGFVTEGYTEQTPHIVIVNNAGNLPTDELNISLSGTNASSFMLNKTLIPSIALGEINNFSITPRTGLTEGTYTATVTVSGTNVASRSLIVSFTVNSASGPPIINASSLPEGNVGIAYSAILTAAGTTPITWSINSSSMPVGLSLSNGGAISGIPTTAGTFNFTVKATNSAGSDTRQFSIGISESGAEIITVNPKYSSSINYAAAKMPDISATNLEIVEGRVTMRKPIAEAIAKELLETDDVEVVLLPWFEATIQSGKTAAVKIPIRGGLLYANYPRDILLLKVMSSDSGEFLEYAASEADYSDGKFTLLSKGNETPYSGKINSGAEYDLIIFIKDGGRFDLDKTINGNVVDPITIARRVQSGGESGGGGCSTSYGYLAFILLGTVLLVRRNI
jgi:subtilisin family serine protease/uncharacterized membrane protein